MYLFVLTMKTFNGILALGILAYSVAVAIACPVLRKKGKLAVMRILCVLPVVAAVVHFAISGSRTFWAYKFLYLEALLPLINLLPGKSRGLMNVKSITSSVAVFGVCFYFLLNAISAPMVHNYTRYGYTKSFTKMLSTLEKEYVLGSWKQIDYDALLEEFLPRVQQAEKNGDELEYAKVITEVTYRFYDTHVYTNLDNDLFLSACEYYSGNDYGLSMIRLDDGSVIAVFVEPGCEAERLGIHNGTTIISWDNTDINEALESVECVHPMLQFPVKSNEDVFRPIFLAGKGGDSVEIGFTDDSGISRSVNVKKLGSSDDRFDCAYVMLLHRHNMDRTNNYACMLDDKCGYLRVLSESFDPLLDDISAVRNGYYPELTEHYAGIIQELVDQGMERLVIDIRNNGGGYDSCAGALASLFTDEKTHMVSFGYENKKGYHIKDTQYIFPDGRFGDIPVVCLVNSNCMSAGDGLAKFLGDCPNVTLMGITASSGVNQNNGGYIFLTENIGIGYPVFLSLSEDGVPLIDTDYTRENRIPLDVTIPMTREMALEIFTLDENDPELAFAMDYLEKSASPNS